MSTPLFANSWYGDVDTDELRKEVQALYGRVDSVESSLGASIDGISLTWGAITGKPTTFPPDAHTHDDRYYTEAEVDAFLTNKSDVGHTHDSRYYTESEVDALIAGATFNPDVALTFGWAGDVAGQNRLIIAGDNEADDTLLDVRSTSGSTIGSALTTGDRKFVVWGDGDVDIAKNLSVTGQLILQGYVLEDSTDRPGLLEINQLGASGYTGVQFVHGSNLWSVMGNASVVGIFDDLNGDWIVRGNANGSTELMHDGVIKLQTVAGGVSFAGNLSDVDNIYLADNVIHAGDTDTYMGFHTADQWRVVTANVERLEANATGVTVRRLMAFGMLTTSTSVSAGGIYTPSGGLYTWTHTGTARYAPQILVSGVWQEGALTETSGTIGSDGTNVRLANTDAEAGTVYLARFGG